MTWKSTGFAAVIALSTVAAAAAQARTLHDAVQDQQENPVTAQLNERQLGYASPGYNAGYNAGYGYAAQPRMIHDTAQDMRENPITAQLNAQQLGYTPPGYNYGYGAGYSYAAPQQRWIIQPQSAQMPAGPPCTPGMLGCAPVRYDWR